MRNGFDSTAAVGMIGTAAVVLGVFAFIVIVTVPPVRQWLGWDWRHCAALLAVLVAARVAIDVS